MKALNFWKKRVEYSGEPWYVDDRATLRRGIWLDTRYTLSLQADLVVGVLSECMAFVRGA